MAVGGLGPGVGLDADAVATQAQVTSVGTYSSAPHHRLHRVSPRLQPHPKAEGSGTWLSCSIGFPKSRVGTGGHRRLCGQRTDRRTQYLRPPRSGNEAQCVDAKFKLGAAADECRAHLLVEAVPAELQPQYIRVGVPLEAAERGLGMRSSIAGHGSQAKPGCTPSRSLPAPHLPHSPIAVGSAHPASVPRSLYGDAAS